MALPNSLVLASEVIGFISFIFTLFTALGVYADLIKTLRGAPAAIPIALGNLREEIRYEQALCTQQSSRADQFHVFPATQQKGTRRLQRHEFARLLSSTLRHIWLQFCDIERDFLTEGSRPSTKLDGSDEEVDEQYQLNEKGGSSYRRSRPPPPPSVRQVGRKDSYIKSRMGWIEAGLSRDRQTYYNTDMSHRLLWWWKKDDVSQLAKEVQRIQIRRVEHDAYETNVLAKRALRLYGRASGDDVFRRSSSDGGSSDGGNGGRSSGDDDGGGPRGGRGGAAAAGAGHDRRRRRKRHSGAAVAAPASRLHPSRRRSRNGGGGAVQEVSEKETVRRRAPSPATPSHHASLPPHRRGSVVYEYEIVDLGGIHVEYQYQNPPPRAARQEQTWREREDRSRRRSYSRPRRDDSSDDDEED